MYYFVVRNDVIFIKKSTDKQYAFYMLWPGNNLVLYQTESHRKWITCIHKTTDSPSQEVDNEFAKHIKKW